MRTAIFIDGAYLDYVLKVDFGAPPIDFSKLPSRLAGITNVFRTYYYHALPYLSDPPTEAEQDFYRRKRNFYQVLESMPRMQVKLGRLEFRGQNADGKPIFEQKRVDLLFGLDLAVLATKHLITDAVLVTGDSDMLPAVELAKAEGVIIKLYHGIKNRPHSDLWNAADERVAFTQELINSIRR
jgi:uncharacterized LabA/DUF88 family protein